MNDIEYALNITMNESISKCHPIFKNSDIYEHYLRKATRKNSYSYSFIQTGDWDAVYALTMVYNYPHLYKD